MEGRMNSTAYHTVFYERIFIVSGLISFCINFLPLLNWKGPEGKAFFPLLLNLCLANTVKSSAHYVSGLKTVFAQNYESDSSKLGRTDWSQAWLFIGYQAVDWSTISIAFDRFISIAYSDQYDGTGRFYRVAVIGGSWMMTILVSTVACIYAGSGQNFWTDTSVYKMNPPPRLLGLFRCLDTACALACFVFLSSTVIAYAKRTRKRRQRMKWKAKVKVGAPSRKTATIKFPLRHHCHSYIDQTKSTPPSVIPTFISLYFNATMWLLPCLVSLTRTAASDTVNIPDVTLFILATLKSLHGSVDVIIYTFLLAGLGNRIQTRLRRSPNLPLRNGSPNGSDTAYQACSSAGTSIVHSGYVHVDDMEDGSSYYPY